MTDKIDYFVHESAYVDEGCEIGEGTRIWHFCHVQRAAKIGKHCVLGQNVLVGPGVVIGNQVKIQNNVSVYAGVEIEDDVFCGPSMVFTNVINPRAHVERKDEFKRTVVKKGSTIGANATVICGITLGKYCFIGAGAVVTKDVPAHAMMMGVPAVEKGWVCACGVRLSPIEDHLRCKACDREYEISKEGLVCVES